MNAFNRTWAIVLAAGEGSRLRNLTTTSIGDSVPKQFCSLRGGLSFLHEAIRRAEAITSRERICVVVAQQHKRWWQPALSSMCPENIIVQPSNRGTANGILLPLLHIMARDPFARVVLLPSDHHVRDEAVLTRSLQIALRETARLSNAAILLGIAPEESDPELGYILPAASDGVLARVERFIEKPHAPYAHQLIAEGALWNAFIVAARADALLRLFERRFSQLVADMQAVVAHDEADPQNPVAAAHLYERLSDIDFSRHIMQGAESALRTLAVPSCGWSDLGTPKRVAQTLRRFPSTNAFHDESLSGSFGFLNLAAQHASLANESERLYGRA